MLIHSFPQHSVRKCLSLIPASLQHKTRLMSFADGYQTQCLMSGSTDLTRKKMISTLRVNNFSLKKKLMKKKILKIEAQDHFFLCTTMLANRPSSQTYPSHPSSVSPSPRVSLCSSQLVKARGQCGYRLLSRPTASPWAPSLEVMRHHNHYVA